MLVVDVSCGGDETIAREVVRLGDRRIRTMVGWWSDNTDTMVMAGATAMAMSRYLATAIELFENSSLSLKTGKRGGAVQPLYGSGRKTNLNLSHVTCSRRQKRVGWDDNLAELLR